MPKFDIKTFTAATNQGSLVNAIGTQYGVPSCIMNLGANLLGALPTGVLNGIRNDLAIGKGAAQSVVKALAIKLRNLTGIIEYDTDQGVFRFVSDASEYGKEAGNVLGEINSFVQQATAFGAELWRNYELVQGQVDDIIDCIGGYEDYLGYVGGDQGEARAGLDLSSFTILLENELANSMQEANDAKGFVASATATLADIDGILRARALDPSLEPDFSTSPSAGPEDLGSLIRLDSGPPDANSGRFLLSVDGLYYDSVLDGIQPVLKELSDRQEGLDSSLDWKLENDPNLGGKGVPTTIQELDIYFDTIMDPNKCDESSFLQTYYDQDDTITNLIGQRDRRVYDLSAQLDEQIAGGAAQAIIDNLRQVMISESTQFMTKIKKRKKQVELAVKMPSIYRTGPIPNPGQVPVNDFSYLNGVNYVMDLQRQRSITIRQDEVSGVVLPLETKFAKPIESGDAATLNHLLINTIPNGIIIDGAAASASISASLPVVPTLAEDGLFGLYNYLTLKFDNPSGTSYRLKNGTSKGKDYNAQIVGNPSRVLDKGLGIVYLDGVAGPDLTDPRFIASAGNYVKLPSQSLFQDFVYSKNGGTFETWVYTPNLSSSEGFNYNTTVSGLYRLILANENVGLDAQKQAQGDILNMELDEGTGVSRGMIFGFTRDVRFTSSVNPSNNEAENSYADVSLVLAPTQSYDISSAGFIVNRSADSCDSTSSWKGMVLPVSSYYGDLTLSACASSFCQLSLVMNPKLDTVSIYMDGSLLTTSSYLDVFGTASPKIPSIPPTNAFEYNTTNITGPSLEAHKYGPELDEFFTPWILGGGYTDGHSDENFMGGEWGGKVSGLKGYLGCTRFYSKPLTAAEVLNNYNATRQFFKNIRI